MTEGAQQGFSAALTLAAFLTAALSGVAGLGGGTILIGLFYAIGLTPVEAVPLFAAVQFVSNFSRTVAYAGHVEWRATGWFLAAAVPATVLLAPRVQSVDVDLVRLVLAGLILASLAPAPERLPPLPAPAAAAIAGLLNGALGLFVGATGLFVGRLFLRPEWHRETIIGTLALTQALGHALRVAAYGLVGYSAFARPQLLLPMCVAVIAGTALGRRLNESLDEHRFAQLFKALLLLLSLKLLWDGARGLLSG